MFRMGKLSTWIFLFGSYVVLSVSGQDEDLTRTIDKVLTNVQEMNVKMDQLTKNLEKAKCKTGWDSFCGTSGCFCYHSGPRNLKMTAASRYCKHLKSRLVSINSQDEQDFLKKYFNNMERAWIGLYKGKSTRWLDRSSVTYTNWIKGEPSGDGKCVEIMKSQDFKWNDIPCSARRSDMGLICKRRQK